MAGSDRVIDPIKTEMELVSIACAVEKAASHRNGAESRKSYASEEDLLHIQPRNQLVLQRNRGGIPFVESQEERVCVCVFNWLQCAGSQIVHLLDKSVHIVRTDGASTSRIWRAYLPSTTAEYCLVTPRGKTFNSSTRVPLGSAARIRNRAAFSHVADELASCRQDDDSVVIQAASLLCFVATLTFDEQQQPALRAPPTQLVENRSLMRGSIVVLWRLVALALWRTAYGSSCLVGAKGVVVFPRAQYVSSDDSARTPSSNSGLRGAASSTQQINALDGGGHETQQGSGILTKQIARKKVEFDKTASSSMKKQVDESIPDCGTSRIDIAPVNVTGAGRFEWKNLDAFEGSSKVSTIHSICLSILLLGNEIMSCAFRNTQGPCEIWIDSERVFEHQNCVKLFETVSWMKFDYSACRGACLLTFYWLLTDREGKGAEPMSMYRRTCGLVCSYYSLLITAFLDVDECARALRADPQRRLKQQERIWESVHKRNRKQQWQQLVFGFLLLLLFVVRLRIGYQQLHLRLRRYARLAHAHRVLRRDIRLRPSPPASAQASRQTSRVPRASCVTLATSSPPLWGHRLHGNAHNDSHGTVSVHGYWRIHMQQRRNHHRQRPIDAWCWCRAATCCRRAPE